MSIRSKSQRRVRLRDFIPPEEQETLIPCPACDGSGKKAVESEEGKYRVTPCRWCEGRGFVHPAVFKLFARWQRIKLANRLAARCF